MGVRARALRVRRGTFTLAVGAFEAGSGGTAVLGPNGAGKTTLLLALQGLLRGEGRIERPPRSAGVFAQPAVLRGSVLWNVSLAVRSVLRVEPSAAGDRARRALDDVGLGDVLGADARSLSTGQRQRLALARALACEPDALFLDEPFANVDADGRPALRALVGAWAAEPRRTLVLATSSLADAAALCAGALVLRAGAVVHQGPVAALERADDPYVSALLAEYGSPRYEP
jgi:ABC-type multidrug transport system ATPase subunit